VLSAMKNGGGRVWVMTDVVGIRSLEMFDLA
jgi:hypothetical protein